MRCAVILAGVALTAASIGVAPAQARESGSAQGDTTGRYVVLYDEGVSLRAAHQAVRAAGGTIVRENTDVGVATVRSDNSDFAADARRQGAIQGVAHDRSIGRTPQTQRASRAAREAVEKAGHGSGKGHALEHGHGRAEPLAGEQWDMQQIHATVKGSYGAEKGRRDVLVGIMDTGVDASHPDIAPNFDLALSRNFTTDIPVDANGAVIDGPCADEPDQSCSDPATVDENGHGTHVASTIAAPLNRLGIGGVAPRVRIVNIRAGQDSGYFFLQPTIDALTYAGDVGIDVVNMSYYIDPWLFNCADNPADSPADQAEQRTVVAATQRALDYAHAHGVTLISAAGNGATDYTKTVVDSSSPDFASQPGEAPYERTIPPSCISMPSEGTHVISVSATGISTRKAYYSDYGNGYVDVAAPGGDVYDTADNNRDVTKAVLAAYPRSLAEANGELNPDGTPNVDYVVRDCRGSTCGYYQYLQGTSMASPHAVGVAALIVSRYGHHDRVHGGRTLAPDVVEKILRATATEHPCPTPPAFTYTRNVPQPDGSIVTVTATHTCEGSPGSNGFYGNGIVDALRAVRGQH